MEDKNKKYLESLVNSVSYSKERFKLWVGENKYIFGVMSPAGEETTKIGIISQYKTIYDTLQDLDRKIKISFKEAIEYSYCDEVVRKYDLFRITSEEEFKAYYYIENALFRTTILWDMLAQIYRLCYGVKVKVYDVEYKKFFNPKNNFCNGFEEKAKKINSYLCEEDEKECNENDYEFWKGNHKYVNKLRNKMTHRNSFVVPSMNDYDLNLKDHPLCLLKRIIEDYYQASSYISEILDIAEDNCIKAFDEKK